MKEQEVNQTNQPICIGAGLIALDVVISGESTVPAQFLAGGSCGNVLTILSYFGWVSYPIARLSNTGATEILLQDFAKWQVREDFLFISPDGSTPIIIHRILKDKCGAAKHRFEFRNPEDGTYLPSFKPVLASSVPSISKALPTGNVYYFDRISRATLDLAKENKEKGSIVFFEPSTVKNIREFDKCLAVADVVKFSNERIDDYDSHYPIGIAPIEIQTLGKEGLQFRLKGESTWIHVPGYSIDHVVDAAGAGDWCTVGIILRLFSDFTQQIDLLSNDQIVEALEFGQLLSALNCSYEGARGLMYNYNRETLLRHINWLLSVPIPNRHVHNLHSTRPQPTNVPLKISTLIEPTLQYG